MFTSALWTTLCSALSIKQRASTPYHPQTNGQAERTNQTLKQVLRILQIQRPETPWVHLLSLAEMAINNAPISDTEYSPYYLNYGYNPALFGDVPDPTDPVENEDETVSEFTKRLRRGWRDIQKAFEENQRRMVQQANRKRDFYQFRIGDLVLVNQSKHERDSLGPRTPLSPKARGPFSIKKVISLNAMQLDIPHELLGGSTPVFHTSQLIPYQVRILDPVGMLPEDEDDLDDAYGDPSQPPDPPSPPAPSSRVDLSVPPPPPSPPGHDAPSFPNSGPAQEPTHCRAKSPPQQVLTQ